MSAKWPSAVATDADLFVAVNSLQTTLASPLGTGDTSVVLTSSTGFPTAGGVVIENEIIFYTGISGNTLTGCTRGSDGTSAASHTAGLPVGAGIIAKHHNSLKDEIKALETSLATYPKNVKNFGAVGDGVADDSAAISAAIAAAGSGVVYFPAGTYKCSVAVGTADVHLVGDPGSTYLTSLNDNSFILTYIGPMGERRWLKDLRFKGTASNSRGVYINSYGNLNFQNCYFDSLQYGVYSNSSEWLHFFECRFTACTYGAFGTTKNGDILGNDPVFNQNSAAHWYTQCGFWGNGLAVYNDNPDNVNGDSGCYLSFKQCEFLSNTCGIASFDANGLFFPLAIDYCWFEANTSSGTQTAHGHTINNGDYHLNGGSLQLNNVCISSRITLENGVCVSGDNVHFNDATTPLVDADVVGSLSNVLVDKLSGMLLSWAEVRSLRNINAGRSAGARVSHKTSFVLDGLGLNKATTTATCAHGDLPVVAAGSPTRSFVYGDGFYANTCVEVSGTTGDKVYMSGDATTGKYYAVSFAIRSTTAGQSVSLLPGGAAVFLAGTLPLTTDWRTYGIIGISSSTAGAQLYITLNATQAIRVSCFQVVEFSTLQDAQAYLNSTTFLIPTAEVNNVDVQATAAPTTGTWRVGDFVRNSAVTTAGIYGWVCTGAGSPGTWTEIDVLTSASQTIAGAKTFSSATTFSAGIVGTTTNNNAAAGNVGEHGTSVVSSFTNFPTSAQYGDLTSISLPAGDWDVTGTLEAAANGATVTAVLMGISSVAGNDNTGLTQGDNLVNFMGPSATFDSQGVVPSFRVSLASPTTYYLKYRAAYTVATPQATGRISARRVR